MSKTHFLLINCSQLAKLSSLFPNTNTIYVYKFADFHSVGEFIAEWRPLLCYGIQLSVNVEDLQSVLYW